METRKNNTTNRRDVNKSQFKLSALQCRLESTITFSV